MRDKVCKTCKIFVKDEKGARADKCPICRMSSFSRTWKGVVFIKDPNTSEIAKLLGVTHPGKYTLWVK